ncbi:hypothetical protein EHS25_005480 [Saitozyma podzolica]|uniref:RING-type domain-containing protein n=1 Tax=Saitozyma podzolica TaxID=1890683 RepID=A0A427XYS7_9TREE|nr:hypothetical protein EHS25_005480 [Saitozyma podzolica]
MPLPVPRPAHNRPTSTSTATPKQSHRTPPKPALNMSNDAVNPAQWLNFSLPPRQRAVPGSGVIGVPRRSRRGEGWRGGVLSRERYVHANFRFVLKPTETLSYGAHFADPDISMHWQHILQVLVPTFSAFSVAQGYVSSDPSDSAGGGKDTPLGVSFDEAELEGHGEEAERKRRMEEERRGRMCPICLSKPVAGRMTKCGHIFCFPCVLHYIQLSDIPKSAKCPICGDTVHEGMLKSVKYLDATTMLDSAHGEDDDSVSDGTTGSDVKVESASEPGQHHEHRAHDDHTHHFVGGEMEGFEEAQEEASAIDAHQPTPGHRIHMRLMQRPQMTTMALPTSPSWPSDAIPPHTALDYMMGELNRELAELKAEWELLRGDDLGRDFVRAAREKVERQIGKVQAELMTDTVRRGEAEARESWAEAVGGERLERERRKERQRRAKEREERTKAAMEDAPTEFLATQGSTFGTIPPNIEVEPNPMPSPKRNRRRHPAPTGPAPAPPSYYFYQSSLGANVFLHPLDIRILLAHFKSYSLFPPTISFSTSGFDPGTINDELRKRAKYLSHLPAGTEVVFVEAELEEIVGKEGLVAFEQPLKARRAKRRERVKKEDRAKSRWEKAEQEKLPATGPGEDREFALALARSTVETNWSAEPALGSSIGSTSSHFDGTRSAPGPSPNPSPSTSPSTSVWGAHAQPRATFAHALHSHTTSSTPNRPRRQDDPELEAAWEAFGAVSLEDARGSIRESEKGGGGGATGGGGAGVGGGKKGAKKQAKKTLVLGGGMGGRRA